MLEVLAVIAIVAYVIGRQLIGESLRGKRVLLLPAILVVVGLTRLGGGGHHVRPVDVACLVASGVIAAAIGAGQGAMMRLENREGGLWGQMPPRSLVLWAALIGSRVAMTVLASALGAHVAASTAPIVLLLGVNRLGQAALITRRALTAGIPFAREKDGSVFLSDQLSGLGARLTGQGSQSGDGVGGGADRHDPSYDRQAPYGRGDAYDSRYGAYDRNDRYGHQDAYGRESYAQDTYGRESYAQDTYGRDERYDSDRAHDAYARGGAARRDRAGRRAARRYQ